MNHIKHLIPLLLILLSPLAARAQYFHIAIAPENGTYGRYFLAQHYQDKFIYTDSAVATHDMVIFQALKDKKRGVYTLLDGKRKPLFDFVVDDSKNFKIFTDSTFSNRGMTVKGSPANARMFAYLAKLDSANAIAKQLNNQEQHGTKREQKQAAKQLQQLNQDMQHHENQFFAQNRHDLFCQLVSMTRSVQVPDGLNDTARASYIRRHYWDSMDFTFPDLTHTPQLFNRMNYYFFGLLYYQDADTITHYARRLLHRIENDSAMLQYFLTYLLPRYQRSKNIGWDQVYVNLVNDYYLAGKCPWATEAELYNKRQEITFLSQSLIGAHGQELIMADTTQTHWISSHRFPEKYVILWFWDPDCTHCQKQTEELKQLYNQLREQNNKRFEVYAVGYEADVEKWKRYVRTHQLPFINVGGTNVNIDYQIAYNVHGAPSMIILNENRDIILNKTIPTNQILTFLDEYERRKTQH